VLSFIIRSDFFLTVPDGSEFDWARMPVGPGAWEKGESNVSSLPAIEPQFSGLPYCSSFVCTDLFLVTLEFTAQTTELVTINRLDNPFGRRPSF
jgi:hypothetical protein